MANQYLGINVGGDKPADVTSSGSTTSKDIELVINLAATNLDKVSVHKAIEALEYFIDTRDWLK